MHRAAWLAGAVFLLLNCSARLGVLVTAVPPLVLLLGLGGGALCLLPILKPEYVKKVLFLFALTLPLYGFHSYSINSFLFELYVSFLALTLLVHVSRTGQGGRSLILPGLLLLYAMLSGLSLLLLPVRNIFYQAVLWDWATFWNAVYFSTPELPLYPVAAIIRLFQFLLFAVLLANCTKSRELFQTVFLGIFVAVCWSSLAGLLEFYDLINLQWFRPVFVEGADRLQSVFLNPGWFSEFLVVGSPFMLAVLLGSG